MSQDKRRNEKLAGYFYDLSKYAGTIIVIGKFVNPEISVINFFVGMVICIVFAVLGYFLTPKEDSNTVRR